MPSAILLKASFTPAAIPFELFVTSSKNLNSFGPATQNKVKPPAAAFMYSNAFLKVSLNAGSALLVVPATFLSWFSS